MDELQFENIVNEIKSGIGVNSTIITKCFLIGNSNPLDAVLIYVNGLANKEIINRDVLNPLMIYVRENLQSKKNICDYLSKKYISMCNTEISGDLHVAIDRLKRGKTILILQCSSDFIIIDTTGGEYRTISEPVNETALRGTREGFVENLETNISMLRRKIRDKSFTIKMYTLGRRSQTDIALIYLEDIMDADVLNNIIKSLEVVDVDELPGSGALEQYIEPHPYSIFPQIYGTERPDVVEAELMEGRAAILVEGTPHVLIAPASFIEFFQGVEDYNQRTYLSSFTRVLRLIAVFIVITSSSIYLTLIKFNCELIPIKFITPIIQSRTGIALSPFLEILSMEIIIEFLREGGLRLPSKIGQTLSIVGGIIIGDTAVKSKMVSPTTLFIVGISVIASFLIANYDMSLVIRLIRFPMLLLADTMGIFGIAIGWFLLLAHLCSLDSFGAPYLDLKKSDLKDTFIRAHLFKMNNRPVSIPNKNPTRQTDFRSNNKAGGSSG